MKSRIEEIRIQNFRATENARLTLSDLTFLVGRNGAGKSSILDAIEFVREAITDSLPNALSRRDGFESIHRKGAASGDPLGLAIVMHAEIGGGRSVRMLYGFQLADRGTRIREVLRVAPFIEMGFSRDADDFITATKINPSVPKSRLVLPLVVSNQLWEIAFDILAQMRAYEIAPQAIASPMPIQSSTNLDRSGANAGDVLEEVELRPAAHEALIDSLKAVAPGLVRVLGGLERGKRIIDFQQRAGDETHLFRADQMSQGTRRALGILLALHQQPVPSLVLIDEVEDSIHPCAISAILEAVEGFAEQFPIVLTTHSPEVLTERHVTPDRVRVVQWNKGVTQLYLLSDGTKESIDPVTSVGDLLRINALWPNDSPEQFEGDILEFGG